MPSSVNNIERDAFENGRSLLAITVNATNPAYASLGGVLFNKSLTTLVQYPEGLAGPYSVPGTVTSIGDAAFSGGIVAGLTIPLGVTSIGSGTCSYCQSLTNVVIPNSVTNLGASAFENCLNLASVLLSTNLTRR